MIQKHLGLLLFLLVVVQVQLWLGRGSLPEVWSLRTQVQEQAVKNKVLRFGNTKLAAEVQDLKQGVEMVEDRARYELGMLKSSEIFVQTR